MLVTKSGPGSRLYVQPPETPASGSILFVSNAADDFEYGRIQTVPVGFGAGEFALTMQVLLTTGTASSYNFGDAAELTNWSAHNVTPYSAADWWYHGNFLLDGHNNNGSAFHNGTLSCQITNSGRQRWVFGDGAAAQARTGQLHAVYEATAASLRDGNWHKIGFRRRFDGGSGSILEAWQDGAVIATETSTARTDMYAQFWDDFAAQVAAQRGFFYGAEKQAAIGDLSQYADYKGRISEMGFWDSPTDEQMESLTAIVGNETGLLDVIRFAEGSGTEAVGANGTTMTLVNGVAWGAENPF